LLPGAAWQQTGEPVTNAVNSGTAVAGNAHLCPQAFGSRITIDYNGRRHRTLRARGSPPRRSGPNCASAGLRPLSGARPEKIDVKELSAGTSDRDAASHLMAEHETRLRDRLLFGPAAEVARGIMADAFESYLTVGPARPVAYVQNNPTTSLLASIRNADPDLAPS